MSEALYRQGLGADSRMDASVRYYRRDFWSKENLKFSKPHYRMEKAARIITTVASGRDVDLLDVGCGPAALRRLLPPGVRYHGIDMAIQEPAPYLIERDIVASPIGFEDKTFDIVLAQAVFEYVPEVQLQKFGEISEILRPGGTFIATYWNYAHRNPKVYHAHSNVQSIGDFRRDLEQYFTVDRYFPASHNWYHGSPSMQLNKALNMRINVRIPVVSPLLGVEYFFICSPIP